MVHIKVAVRIRPLSAKETNQRDEVIVKKGDQKSILVTNPKVPENQNGDSRLRTHRFAVDYCYDPQFPETCTQDAVYQEVGVDVLNSMFTGYNACIFAYGHSASGKTYTMMGEQEEPGLTPRICRGLFEKMREKTAANEKMQFNIIISFLEIYNERVRDLLVSDDTGQAAGNFSLRVREHPKLGPYVQDLTEHAVQEEEKLLELLALGSSRRSTAATENNIHSSRSHAVFTVRLKQSDEDNFETDKSSKVHLVDLAGSERATSVQSRTRLKEGANINKSLVTLGNVISALAESCEPPAREHSSSKSWHPFVPYRDSVLTWLLKDTLGGNSNTIMIATVSPGSSCLTETINTLRYAKRTKRIVNQPIINEDPKVRTIRELRDEVSKLKNMILSLQICRPDLDPITDISLLDANAIEELINSSSISKWLDTAGNEITKEKSDLQNSDKEINQKSIAGEEKKPKSTESEDQSEVINNNGGKSSKNEKRGIRNLDILGNIEDGESNAEIQKSTPQILIKTPSSSSLAGKVSKINDEKETDVNGLVIDRLPHENQVFSDSLESFSFLRRKSCTQSEYDFSEYDNTSELDHKPYYSLNSLTDTESVDNCVKNGKAADNLKSGGQVKKNTNRKVKHDLKRQFSSCENLSKKSGGKMLHRSRPDLIKGISTRSQDGLPSTSSQSYTDVSGLSQSTSENSLNSSGSVESQPSELKSSKSWSEKSSATVQPINRTKQIKTRASVPAKLTESAAIKPVSRKSSVGDASGSSTPTQAPKVLVKRKENKRSEIVAAVTTRLYATKKKPDARLEALVAAEKEDDDDDGELEELKLCKRARMKLFDLSRKLAMTKRVRKTVDSDTQTEFIGGTIRLKEKCIITDQQGILHFENIATNTPFDKNLKDSQDPPVIMNQVFIPQSSNYIVECGKNLRVEVPGIPAKADFGTQTKPERRKKLQKLSRIDQDDSFSDDSLDSNENKEYDIDPLEGYHKPRRGYFYKAPKIKYHSNENLYREVLYLDNSLIRQVMQNAPLYSRSFDSLLDGRTDKGLPFKIEKSSLPIVRYPICGTNVLYEYDPNKTAPDKIVYSNPGESSTFIKNSPELIYNQYNAEEAHKDQMPNIQVTLFNGLPLAASSGSVSSNENEEFHVIKTNFLSANDNASSENSFASDAGSESSEEFVFYEAPKEKERKLYTIAENSELSDKISSNGSSPQQSQFSSLTERGDGDRAVGKLEGIEEQELPETRNSEGMAGNHVREKYDGGQPVMWKKSEDVIYFEEPLPKESRVDKDMIPKDNKNNENLASADLLVNALQKQNISNQSNTSIEMSLSSANPTELSTSKTTVTDNPTSTNSASMTENPNSTKNLIPNSNPISIMPSKIENPSSRLNDPALNSEINTISLTASSDSQATASYKNTKNNELLTNQTYEVHQSNAVPSNTTTWPSNSDSQSQHRANPETSHTENPSPFTSPTSEGNSFLGPSTSSTPFINTTTWSSNPDGRVLHNTNPESSHKEIPTPFINTTPTYATNGRNEFLRPSTSSTPLSENDQGPSGSATTTQTSTTPRTVPLTSFSAGHTQSQNNPTEHDTQVPTFNQKNKSESVPKTETANLTSKFSARSPIFLYTSEDKDKAPGVIIKLTQTNDPSSEPKVIQIKRNEKGKKINWADVQQSVQRQFLNFNILGSSRPSPFSIEILGESTKREPGLEAAFSSEDSITFVFMGPSNQKTSILMEIIKRSLNSEEKKPTHKSRSQGVQCNSKLMRSVSVDTAMIALSKFAKNQRPSTDMPRTSSLDTLVPEEMQMILEQGRLHNVRESSCQCNLDSNFDAAPNPSCTCQKRIVKCDSYTVTTCDRETETDEEKKESTTTQTLKQDVMFTSGSQTRLDVDSVLIPSDNENLFEEKESVELPRKKPGPQVEGRWEELKNLVLGKTQEKSNAEDKGKKSLSWSNNTSRDFYDDWEELDTSDLDYTPREKNYYQEKQPSSLDSSSQTRRVRFSEPQKWDLAEICQLISEQKETQTAESMSAFLKEATQLLKNLNEVSKLCENKDAASLPQKKKTTIVVKEPNPFRRKTETSVQTEVEMINERVQTGKSSDGSSSSDNSPVRKQTLVERRQQRKGMLNLTWPRRKPISLCGKPPTGLKFTPPPRSPLPRRPHSSQSFDVLKNNLECSPIGSCSTNWNISNLSTTFSNSYVGDYSRPSSLRSVYTNDIKSNESLDYKYNQHRSLRLNFDSEIEIDMEESCRRLESAIEMDRMRQENLSNRMGIFSTTKYIPGYWREDYHRSLDIPQEKPDLDIKEPTSLIEFRPNKTVQCRLKTCKCYCHRFHNNSSSKVNQSYFEFESLGVKNKHCHLCCISCRDEEFKKYYSAPVLNTNLELQNCNGQCPHSSIKVRQRTSPRIYMQHLLSVRRQIVEASKFAEDSVSSGLSTGSR